jgi:hypothetical protein
MNQRQYEGMERFLKHLPNSEDLALIVLKGHLLLEAEINDNLALALEDPDALKGARLSFAQRVAVLKAVEGKRSTLNLRDGLVQKLNKIRNLLAHHLEHAAIDSEIALFLEEVDKLDIRKDLRDLPVAERLKLGLARLCGEMAGGRAAVKNLTIGSAKGTPNKSLERTRDR